MGPEHVIRTEWPNPNSGYTVTAEIKFNINDHCT